jgi:hypothetical protein
MFINYRAAAGVAFISAFAAIYGLTQLDRCERFMSWASEIYRDSQEEFMSNVHEELFNAREWRIQKPDQSNRQEN